MSRTLPFMERVEDMLIEELKKIGTDEREWFTKPATVLASASDDLFALPRPALVLNITGIKDEAQLGQKYRTTATVDIHCITQGSASVSATRDLHRLMADVKAALAQAYRPTSGLLNSGVMFVVESSVNFEVSQAVKAGVGVVSTEIQWEWSTDAP